MLRTVKYERTENTNDKENFSNVYIHCETIIITMMLENSQMMVQILFYLVWSMYTFDAKNVWNGLVISKKNKK